MITISSLDELRDESLIEELLAAGEGQQLEYKGKIPSTDILARLIAGFANADGGLIIVGFDEINKSVSGIDDSALFFARVEEASQRLGGSPNVSKSILAYKQRQLGAVLILPSGPVAIQSENGYWARLGARTAQYLPGELHPRQNRILQEEAVPLQVSQGELDRFLDEADEDAFTSLLLVPLLRSLGFESVLRKGHKDKSLEFGKDLRGMKYQLPTGHWLYFAAQVKAGTIHYSAERISSVDKIVEQIRTALQTKAMDWQSRIAHRPDHVFLAASGSIVEGARSYLEQQICDGQMKILFWDRDLIIDACARRGLPSVVQRDISRYLRAKEGG